MNMFAKAFEQGLVAAASAEQANEIASVIARANEELLRASAGRISVEISTSATFEVVTNAIAMVHHARNPTTSTARPDHWIVAHNPLANQQSPMKIAKWDQPPEGYPVGINYERISVYCHNRDALEEALENMFSSAWAGEKFKQLMALPVAKNQPQKPLSSDADGE